MSRQINQPINQVRLTNVAVVRMNKGGKRFEIACYRNKVMDYRKGLEKDLSEVLQTERIFTNVSKGEFAKHADLEKVFGTKDEDAMVRQILLQGQLQVSDLERQVEMENTLAQIATWIANNCVHPTSQRPYTVSQIKHALGKQYQVQTHKPIKKQYLDCVKFLKMVIPIDRAKMELALSWQTTPASDEGESPRQQLDQLLQKEESLSLTSQEILAESNTTRCILLADPSLYRVLDDLAKTLPQGKLEIVRQVVTLEGDVDLEMEIERKHQLQQQQQQQHQEFQQSQPTAANAASNNKEDVSDEENAVDTLTRQLPRKVKIENNNHDDSDEDDEEQRDARQNQGDNGNRKQQLNKDKKKQSKKAKRRQRELEAEREAQAKKEQERQEARRQARGETLLVEEAPASAAAENNVAPGEASNNNKSCNTCGGNFVNAAAYRAHFKSDWHRFNQKLKMQGMPPVSEREFALCDAETFFGSETILT